MRRGHTLHCIAVKDSRNAWPLCIHTCKGCDTCCCEGDMTTITTLCASWQRGVQYLHKHAEVVLQGSVLECWVVHGPPLAAIFIVGILNGVVSYQWPKQVKQHL